MFKAQQSFEKIHYTQLRKQVQSNDTITAEALTSPLLQNDGMCALHWAANSGV